MAFPQVVPHPEAEDQQPSSGTTDGIPRRRRTFWRSPDDQPPWARPALLAVAAVCGLLFAWNLAHAGYAPLYSVVAKSMSMSWKAFLYGTVDPGATASVDKLAGSFAFQAVSVRIFGFHEWSLALPQVIEGVIAVLVLYRVVRRWRGPAAGLLAAALLGLTPIVTSMFGHSMEDGALTLFLVLAADAYQRAAGEARLRSLMLAAVWLGVGFQCKMLQAWIVVPALAVSYLVTAPAPLGRRLLHVLTAGVVTVAVSSSWILLYTLTPAADRPYVDGTTNDSALVMVVGYNGLDRLGVNVPGTLRGAGSHGKGTGPTTQGKGGGPLAPSDSPSQPADQGPQNDVGPGTHTGGSATGDNGGPGTSGGSANSSGAEGDRPQGGTSERTGGWTKLLQPDIATQTGWLYPAALLTTVLGLWWYRRAGRTDRVWGGYLMWSLWFVTSALVFSKIDVSHKAYLATLSIAIAALAGAGIVELWQAYLAGGRRAWAVPVLVLAELAWTLYLSWGYLDFLPGLVPLVVVTGLAAVAAMVATLLRKGGRRPAVLAAGVAAILLVPTAWAASVLYPRYAGDSFEAGAGPSNVHEGGGPYRLTSLESALLGYTRARDAGTEYLFATTSFDTAGTFIAAASAKVLPIGGFRESVPVPSLARLKQLVAGGDLRFILVGGSASLGYTGTTVSPVIDQVTQWVHADCTEVTPAQYAGAGQEGDPDLGNLYRCGPA